MNAKYKNIASLLLLHPACVSLHMDRHGILAWFSSESIKSAWISITNLRGTPEVKFEVVYRENSNAHTDFESLGRVVQASLLAA